MIYLLDTNTCIKYLNGRSESIRQRLASTRPQDILLCAAVCPAGYGPAGGAVSSGRDDPGWDIAQ